MTCSSYADRHRCWQHSSDVRAQQCGCSAPSPACRFAAGEAAHILWSASIRQAEDTQAMVQRLHQGGMPTLDISGLEPAQVCYLTAAC